MMKTLLIGLLLSVISTWAGFAKANNDSLRIITRGDCIELTGALFLAGGILSYSSDHHYSHTGTASMDRHYGIVDDIFRYLPTAARVTLRMAGVECKSQKKRVIISRIGSYGMGMAASEGLKLILMQRRPDGRDRKSTPSGHAMFAFMGAAIITEEYGHLTPFVPLGSYAISSLVGFRRMLGNHHYASDVLMGAGIGILASKGSFFLTDVLLKGKGRNWNDNNQKYSLSEKPSFVGLHDAYALSLNDISRGGHTYDQTPGLTIGLSGTWYFHPMIGIAARVAETRSFLSVDGKLSSTPIDRFASMAGMSFSYPIGNVRVGAEIMEGYSWQTSHFKSLRMTGMCSPEGLASCIGLNVQIPYKEHLGVRFQVDYETISAAERLHYIGPAISLHYSF